GGGPDPRARRAAVLPLGVDVGVRPAEGLASAPLPGAVPPQHAGLDAATLPASDHDDQDVPVRPPPTRRIHRGVPPTPDERRARERFRGGGGGCSGGRWWLPAAATATAGRGGSLSYTTTSSRCCW
ncbi:unnamed protein product, partial [Ectocarpus sp. 12 AP-2014]